MGRSKLICIYSWKGLVFGLIRKYIWSRKLSNNIFCVFSDFYKVATCEYCGIFEEYIETTNKFTKFVHFNYQQSWFEWDLNMMADQPFMDDFEPTIFQEKIITINKDSMYSCSSMYLFHWFWVTLCVLINNCESLVKFNLIIDCAKSG